jgi:hypothetical protein
VEAIDLPFGSHQPEKLGYPELWAMKSAKELVAQAIFA